MSYYLKTIDKIYLYLLPLHIQRMNEEYLATDTDLLVAADILTAYTVSLHTLNFHDIA